MTLSSLARLAPDAIARIALRVPVLERAIVAGVRRPTLRRLLRLGAVAHGYQRVLRGRELRIASFEGYKFYVNVAESLGIEPYFFGETGTVWLTRHLIRPGDVCVDAGANAGHYTFFCSSIVGPTGRVFAFEPNPEFAELIRRSIALNGFDGFVSVHPHALYSRGGETRRFLLSTNAANTGTSSLVDHGWFLSPERAIEVTTITFDEFASNVGVDRFRLVKIDVERAEDDVIAGASRTLREGRIDFMILEMAAGGRAQELMEKAAYRGYLVSPHGRGITPLKEVARDSFGDFLFVRPGLELPPLV